MPRRYKQLKSKSKGNKFLTKRRMPNDPPGFNQIPWWRVTVSDEIVVSQTKQYTGEDIYGLIQAQTGLISTNDWSYRITVARGWNLSGGPINLEAYDLLKTGGTDDYLCQKEDQPGRNHWAKVGFKWPAAQRKAIFTNSDKEVIVSFSGNVKDKLVIYLSILLKPRTHTLPNVPSRAILSNRIDQLERLVSSLKRCDDDSSVNSAAQGLSKENLNHKTSRIDPVTKIEGYLEGMTSYTRVLKDTSCSSASLLEDAPRRITRVKRDHVSIGSSVWF